MWGWGAVALEGEVLGCEAWSPSFRGSNACKQIGFSECELSASPSESQVGLPLNRCTRVERDWFGCDQVAAGRRRRFVVVVGMECRQKKKKPTPPPDP